MDSEPETYLSDIEQEDDDTDTSGIAEAGNQDISITGKKCWDVGLASEEDIEGFLAESGDNIVFIIESGNASVCIERETIKNTILDNKDYYYYLCRGAFERHNGQLPIGVSSRNVCEVPVFGLGFLGLSTRGLVIRENFINAVNDTADQNFVIRSFNPAVKASAVSGVSYLRAGPTGQGAIGSMHCQPDIEDEMYYITASNKNIVPDNIKDTIDTLIANGCLVKKDEYALTQVAYNGRPASPEAEAKLRELKASTDFPVNDSNEGDYLDTFVYSEDLPETIISYTKAISHMLYENTRPLMPQLSPNANVAEQLRFDAMDALLPHVANYYLTLLDGLARADSGLIIIQTTKSSPSSSSTEYRLKPILKIDDFPPSQPGLGVAFSEQTLNILDNQNETILDKLRYVLATSSQTQGDVLPVVENASIVLHKTNSYRKEDKLIAYLICVTVSQVTLRDGNGFDSDEVAQSYYSTAKTVLDMTKDYLRDRNPLRAFTIPRMPVGMELIQFSLSLTSPLMHMNVTSMRPVGLMNPPRLMMEQKITNLQNIFTYLDIQSSTDDSESESE